jgi:hypothetical protein
MKRFVREEFEGSNSAGGLPSRHIQHDPVCTHHGRYLEFRFPPLRAGSSERTPPAHRNLIQRLPFLGRLLDQPRKTGIIAVDSELYTCQLVSFVKCCEADR